MFETSRKLGGTHQRVLFFVKGDPKAATEAIGAVEFAEIEGAGWRRRRRPKPRRGSRARLAGEATEVRRAAHRRLAERSGDPATLRGGWLRPSSRSTKAFFVVREDLVAGGSKIRFLPHIVGDAKEIVFGGPFCGGAPYALAVWGARMGAKITLFYAKRNELHWRQEAAFRLGAQIYQVPAGRMSVVQHRARKYAADHGALFLPLGFDLKPTPPIPSWK
jgi:hypothetical protein